MDNYQAPADLLSGRVILVTGAGQGIGRIAALTFAAHGATVILHGRKVQKLEAVYDEMEQAGYPQPAIFPLDLEKAEGKDFAALAQAISSQIGRLDGILHNAAHFTSLTPLEHQNLESWLATLRVNLMAPFALTQACMPLLKKAPDASVVVTGETHGHAPSAYWGPYAVSKCGLEAMVTIWAQELEIYSNVRINALIPGPVDSPLRLRTHPAELKDTMRKPEDLMSTYLYLMGRDSAGTTGQVLAC
ncbi:MAG: YciK family oxidoreductase [Betaproteobacteria bacterium]|nr:YciK family oxidoreductase [Betaproteobacteria bacterium]